MGKQLVLCKNSSKQSASRKIKTFFGSTGDTYKGPRKFRNCKGIQDTLRKKPNTGESSLHASHGSGTSNPNTSGDREHVEKGSHTADGHHAGEFVRNNFLIGKRNRENEPVVNLRYQMPAFQNGSFVLPLRITTGGRLHVQTGYERCLFFSSSASLIKELYSIFMVRESLRVPLFMLPLGNSSKNPHKIAKIPMSILRRINNRKVIHLDDMLIMGQPME